MSLVLPKETGGDFELTPAGAFPALCYRVVDLGTQQVEWEGNLKRQHKILLSWELPDELMSDGRPFSMHQRYTLSSSEKSTLRKHLESWRGVPFTDADFGAFDITRLLGAPCMLNVMHAHKAGKTYANLASIMRLPKGMTPPVPVNEPLQFSLSDFKQDVFDKLSQGLQAVIAKSPEYQELMGAHHVEQQAGDDGGYANAGAFATDDEIPF